MTRDDIIRMAREAGFSAYHLAVLDQGIYRFANLVAAAAREVGVCCQEFDKCLRSCTPRGQWIAHVRCGCGDQIMRDDGAECGTCVTARNAVKGEWQTLTDEEITTIGITHQSLHQVARAIEAKLKEKNHD
jgi:hypothetical protein